MKKNAFNFFAIVLMMLPMQIFASNYYWVGGTGNYSDSTHWATTSGGSTFQTYSPTDTDDVFFDVNSFTTADDTIYFDRDYSYAHHFSVNGVQNSPTFFDGLAATDITIWGNLILDPNINWQSTVPIEFGNDDTFSTVQTNGIVLGNDLYFTYSGFEYAYALLGDIHCAEFHLDGGKFATQNHNIYCSRFFLNSTDTLFLGTSIINCINDINFFIGGGVSNPPLYSDSSVFNGGTSFDIELSCTNVHLGTLIGVQSITSNYCYYKSIESTALVTASLNGFGNHIDEVTGNFDEGTGLLGSPANFISKVVATDYFNANNNSVIDTLIFLDPGATLDILDTLTINGEIIMNNTPARRGLIQEFGDSGYFSVSSGAVCFDFIDIGNIYAIGGAQFYAGYNSTAFPAHVWQISGCITAGGVWPGDANYDLTVNNLDILAIGLANGETGPVRAGASSSWVEQPVADWANTFSSGVNMKHADCDGNGTVDASDTAAVSINYGLHHPAARMIDQQANPNSNSLLTIDVTPDTVGPSSPVHVNVDLGMDSIYGIAFSIFYDPSLINSSSLIPDFSNSWLGTNGVNMIGFAKADPVAGRIDFAITRTDHTDAFAGTGHLISFDLITADNIPVASSLTMEANDVSGVYLAQNYEVINGSTDSTFVDSTVSVLQPGKAFTNLTGYLLNQDLNLNYYCFRETNLRLIITDITGRELLKENLVAAAGLNKNEIHTGNLAKGIYIVNLSDAGGSQSVKVAKE